MFSIIGQYTVLFFHFLYFSVCQVAVGLYHVWTVFFDNFGEILFVRYAQLIFADAARHGCHGNGAVKVAQDGMVFQVPFPRYNVGYFQCHGKFMVRGA